ncbi:C-type lectin-related protein 4 [Elysia marginata]|uniref:C-type lectin-related protein 4 n=1 Tax=Elysia marginata TaxID=1093978 RepID=A0AAV4HXW9_9GAST|nr:C-type lectin-related protein 4 [Elysia marginata]
MCRPIFWRPGYDTEIPVVRPGNSSLYRFGNSACKPGFQEYHYHDGNKTISTCLSFGAPKVYYWVALRLCSEQNAFLASAKTLDKLALLVQLAQGNLLWVGLDDRNENKVFVWVEDGTVISPEKMEELFVPGEPNHGREQDCVAVKPPDTKMRDVVCANSKMFYFCETKPGC